MTDPLPFTQFSDTFSSLSDLLDSIKQMAPQGSPLATKDPLGRPLDPPPPPGVTDSGAKSYGDAYSKAKSTIDDVTKGLSVDQLGALIGLGFTDPSDDSKKRTDVTNSLLSAYDKSAAKYMKCATSDGDAARPELQQRLQAFDTAIQTSGKTPVTPDQ